jgi:hypothetical protein
MTELLIGLWIVGNIIWWGSVLFWIFNSESILD